MSQHSQIKPYRNSKGQIRYQIEIWHAELGERQTIQGTQQNQVWQSAVKKMKRWDDQWERQQKSRQIEAKKERAALRTQEAQEALAALEHVLADALNIDHGIDWGTLKDRSEFTEPMPKKPLPAKAGCLTKLIPSMRRGFERKVEQQQQRFAETTADWESRRDAFFKTIDEQHKSIDEKGEKHQEGDPETVIEYCHMVLSNSQYPDSFPKNWDLDYNPDSRLLIVDCQLPSLGDIPTRREVTFVQSRDEFTEKHLPQSQIDKLYDRILYQITLRTIHELFDADEADVLATITFNGYVSSIDPATGHERNPCVLTVQAGKEEFSQINLELIEPRACFKGLKGIGSPKLHSLTPVAPILRIEREDARFISAYGVADGLQEGDNLAAMDWEDFEHLVRELFEQEFAVGGGEVKVTRASRDGGVDAVAFDPDPIRGGKIVIQAKRYVGTVGVSAVRDLYGTILNEGANKGIIVTTSHYGPDAYEFAKGKPLVLIDGNNLLHLLEKHGHKARIDLQEAKRMLAEKE
jgi:restriction system protein